MNQRHSIFAKRKRVVTDNDISDECRSVSREKIMGSIPSDALSHPDPKLAATMNEIRWRIFKLPNRKNDMIEMSNKEPNADRKYLTYDGKWINYDELPELNPFVIKSYYYYQSLDDTHTHMNADTNTDTDIHKRETSLAKNSSTSNAKPSTSSATTTSKVAPVTRNRSLTSSEE